MDTPTGPISLADLARQGAAEERAWTPAPVPAGVKARKVRLVVTVTDIGCNMFAAAVWKKRGSRVTCVERTQRSGDPTRAANAVLSTYERACKPGMVMDVTRVDQPSGLPFKAAENAASDILIGKAGV